MQRDTANAMDSFREQVQHIAHAEMGLEVKAAQLFSLGLTKADVNNLLYRELNHTAAERNTKRASGITHRIAKKNKAPNRSRQMKCLAIRQPWATLIAAGIKDIECRDKLVPPCKRFLIAASKTRDAKRLDEVLDGQLLDVVNGYIAKGILQPYEQWPTGAIIGYVDIKEVTYGDVASPWGCGVDGIKYVLKNAHMFNKPIYGKNKATPLFYNVDGYDNQHMPPSRIICQNV